MTNPAAFSFNRPAVATCSPDGSTDHRIARDGLVAFQHRAAIINIFLATRIANGTHGAFHPAVPGVCNILNRQTARRAQPLHVAGRGMPGLS